MDKRRNCSTGAISPQEQFLPFSTIFSTYVSNYWSLITCSFVKFGCSTSIFLISAHLICRSTDISQCFRGSLRLRDNESRLYMQYTLFSISTHFNTSHVLCIKGIKFNPLYTVGSSTVICWVSPFVILGVSGLFCRFYSIFDGKSCKQTM